MTTTSWADVLAAALVGTARNGGRPEALLDAAAAHALRRRAGVPLVRGAQAPPPAPLDDTVPVGPAAAARAEELLAFDSVTRGSGQAPRDMAGRLEVLAEWLAAAAGAGRRLPPELVPALLDAGRRHHPIRPLIAPAAGPLANWLATQRADWAYAAPAATTVPATTVPVATVPVAGGGPACSEVDDESGWELGEIGRRTAFLRALRRRDPARARRRLDSAWPAEPPEDRAVLLSTFQIGLSIDDEALLERALDDRHRRVRGVALDLLAKLPGSAYGRRMADRAAACVDVAIGDERDGRGGIAIHPPTECDRAMRRDGIAPRPPAGVGERAWWLEEILARTPLQTWPRRQAWLARVPAEGWGAAVRRGLARAAATQADAGWAAALLDRLVADVAAQSRPDDESLLEALYAALSPQDLAARVAGALRRGLAGAAASGTERALALCPRPWPPAVADAVFATLAEQLTHPAAAWRLTSLCELAALRLPAGEAQRAATLAGRLRDAYPRHPGLTVVERLAATLHYRHQMLEELT